MLDINAPEFLLLLVLAVVIFGPDKLPDFARKAAHVVRYVRDIAGNAQTQISKELGPEFQDLDFRDLNPKAFVRKHLMEDVDPIVADVKKDLEGLSDDDEITTKALSEGGPDDLTGDGEHDLMAVATPRPRTPFDPDAT